MPCVHTPRHVLLIALCVCTVHRSVAQTLSATLTTSNYNGFHISCFGAKDGSLQAVATGGTPPYTYEWSTAATTASIGSLAAGYYKVKVGDANANAVEVDITLQEPLVLKVEAKPHTYPGGTNISCYNCYNGSIAVHVFQGVAPYSYEWSDGSTLEDRTGLGSASYSVKVTDTNGCTSTSESVFLQEPERSDWTMSGNAGTNPATQYIGTSDNKDVVFKANGQEALRLKANGDISLMGSLNGEGPLVRDADGVLRLGGEEHLLTLPSNQCRTRQAFPYWETRGNSFSQLCPEEPMPLLGTLSNMPLHIVTNGSHRMIVTASGNVGIGTDTPTNRLAVKSDNARNGIDLINANEGATTSSEIRFFKGTTQRWGLGSDFSMNGGQDFYLWDHLAVRPDESNELGMVRLRVDSHGRVIIGDNLPAPEGYRLFVQEGILTERVKVAVHDELDWNDHVFNEDYALMPLTEVEQFVRESKHLPGVPSAQEMVSNGLDVAVMDAVLLKKIEELTLHLINVEKRTSQLEGENEMLRSQLNKVKP